MNIPPSTHDFNFFLSKTRGTLHPIFLHPVDPTEVVSIINKLKNTNSCGHDNIPMKLLKMTKHSIATPISILINKSFMEGKFPENLKTVYHLPDSQKR